MDEILDWKFYVIYNTDLKKYGLDTEEKAWEHFIHHGRKEGRLSKKSNLFDWEFYVNKYKDLNGINNETEALLHYYNHGIKEGRLFNRNMLYPGNDVKLLNDNTYICNNNIFDYINKYSANNYKEFIERHTYDNFYPVFLKKNHIDLDLYFYKLINNIEIDSNNNDELINHFHKNGLSKLIYHPKQLKNIYPNIKIFKSKENIKIFYKNNFIPANQFVKEKVYDKTFDQLCKKLVKNIDYKLSSDNLLILVFIGNRYVGDKLIDKLIKYKSIEKKFNVAFCIHYKDNTDKLKEKIRENFKNYGIFITKEMGNDIVPTMIMYNYIKRYNSYKHIIKLQTKSYQEQMDQLSDYLLDKKLERLISLRDDNCNCISNNKYYMRIKDDIFNNELIYKFYKYINIDKLFVIGTIFYANSSIFDAVLNFMKKNDPYAYLLNNMYDNNRIVYKKSYVHFLERLFGIIKV
jgi:hypothetical protein